MRRRESQQTKQTKFINESLEAYTKEGNAT